MQAASPTHPFFHVVFGDQRAVTLRIAQICSIPLRNSQYLEWINEGMLFTSWLEENFVLESFSCCETSPGRLWGIRLLLAGHIGLEAFPEAFLEGRKDEISLLH